MGINWEKLPLINERKWECENCGSSVDLSWIIEDLIEECENNAEYKEALMKEKKEFDHNECNCCNHSIWFYEDELIELQQYIKELE